MTMTERYVTLIGGHCGDCGRESPGYLVNVGADGNVLDGWDDTLPTKILPFPVKIWAKEIEAGQWDMSCAACGGTVLAELEPGGIAPREPVPPAAPGAGQS